MEKFRLPLGRQWLFAVVLAAATGVAAAADPKASKYYEDALQRFEKQDHKGAIIQLRNALKIDRNMLPAQLLMGQALLANGELGAAQVAFEEAIRLGASTSEVALPLARTFIAQGKPDALLSDSRFSHAGLPRDAKIAVLLLKASAASDFAKPRDALVFVDEARALDPNGIESWLAEVPIRVRARQFTEAKLAADKAVTLDPKSPKAAYQQATVAHVTGDLKSAVAMYTRTLSLKPDHVDALVARGGLHIDLNQIPLAKADVKAARDADPKDPRAAYLWALLMEREGNAAATKAALLQVTNLVDPYPLESLRYRPQVLMLGGLSHFALNQHEKARPYLELVARQDSHSPVSKLLAQIYLKEKQVDKAIAALEAYLRTRSDDRQAIMMLASANMAQGRHAKATQLIEEGLKAGEDPSMRALLGMSMVGSGRFETAQTELEATLKKDPTQVRAGVSLVSLYLGSGQPSKAVTVAQSLVKQQPQNPGLHNLLGNALAARGDVAAARESFEQALKLDPKFNEPLLNLARIDTDQRAFDAARTRLNTLLSRNEKDVDVLLESARLFALRGQYDEAQRWLQRAEDASGARLQAGLQAVEFYLARGRIDMAKEAVKRLQGKAPDAMLVLLAHARTLVANNELAEARTVLTRASSQAGFDAATLTRIAELQLQADNLAGASHALDKALQAKPTHLRARALRSTTYLLEGDFTKAEQLARSVLTSDPKLALGHGLLGDIALARKQPAQAVEAYKRAHQAEPGSESLVRWFNALSGTQPGAAVSLAEQWLRERPQDTRVWRSLGDFQARSGNFAAAKSAYQKLLQLEPRDAESLNNLAIVLVSLGDADALKVADQALALKPQTPHILGTTGWAAFHAGQSDRALQLLRDARLRDPNNPATRYFLAAVLAKQGRKAEARQEVQSALQSAPEFAYAKPAKELLRTLE